MGKNEKVGNKHYCNICRIWIENHPNNIRTHQEGGRHRYNQRKYFKSENYKEFQNKKMKDEIQEELMRMNSGVALVKESVIKSIQKTKSSQNVNLKSNVFSPCSNFNATQSLRPMPKTRDEDYYEGTEHKGGHSDCYSAPENNNKSQETYIGEWEEVKEGESVFNSDISFNSNIHMFIGSDKDKGIEIKNSSISTLNHSMVGCDEYQGLYIKDDLNYDSHEGSKRKIHVKFNSRKPPSHSLRSS
ncbi:U1 small nuclear ribonucleoprotein c like finger [Cryptosporidium ryanae]|uniref:U1 small nuclear ribonucleoprotein c like finger n=1 Tax=Cryptosporidium ryanae TaxID=515981 RepID=UPI00351A2558|nr:U1 small nuclear ribonucleoprotein c like finger [Cryptosporidium ryanae]